MTDSISKLKLSSSFTDYEMFPTLPLCLSCIKKFGKSFKKLITIQKLMWGIRVKQQTHIRNTICNLYWQLRLKMKLK